MLCHRCEYRALFLETGSGPRHECKQPDINLISCYQYTPVCPVIVQVDEKDPRPPFAGIFGARLQAVEVAPCGIYHAEHEGKYVSYAVPMMAKKEDK